MDNEIFDFLMFDLGEVADAFEDDSKRAEEIMIILSAVSGNIPETFYRLYTTPLLVGPKAIDEDVMKRALNYYSGIGEVSVFCDCEPGDQYLCDIHDMSHNEYFEFGEESIGSTKEWYAARMRVRELQADLRG